jgi:hypothetical protein
MGIWNSKFYSHLTKVCQLEGLDVVCINTNTNVVKEVTPTIDILSKLFRSYVQAFTNFTEHFLLYYLYQNPAVSQNFKLSDLM